MSPFTLLGTIKIFVKKWNPNFKKINNPEKTMLRTVVSTDRSEFTEPQSPGCSN